MKKIFTDIYESNLWGGTESLSGPGSSLMEVEPLMRKLPHLFELFEINSILDAPCGDFHWMSKIPLNIDKYFGVDIVSEIVENNNRKYKSDSYEFLERDVTQDALPSTDLILCRDLLVHLSFEDIKKWFQNVSKNDYTYLLTTHYPSVIDNLDINTGDWRPINFCRPPFSFDAPLVMMREYQSFKTLSLWRWSDIRRSQPFLF
ncbi:class I SAM-dependent methyltransferase [Shimazuella sp. KC615]|uniref:Class I SAM-dependent methyltransferase n=1 Tax=Shimazuella alba TaxID=2690964 RepID=A0A6I4VPC5_9BACL|nr:class I SAM-dependent methyltransferase [Shimazuella alba]